MLTRRAVDLFTVDVWERVLHYVVYSHDPILDGYVTVSCADIRQLLRVISPALHDQ